MTTQIEPIAQAEQPSATLPMLIIATGAVATVAWIAILGIGAVLSVDRLVNLVFG